VAGKTGSSDTVPDYNGRRILRKELLPKNGLPPIQKFIPDLFNSTLAPSLPSTAEVNLSRTRAIPTEPPNFSPFILSALRTARYLL